jgi:hypothetical protein
LADADFLKVDRNVASIVLLWLITQDMEALGQENRKASPAMGKMLQRCCGRSMEQQYNQI